MGQDNQVKKRIYYLDIARGFAIFGMFTQHCMVVHEVSRGEGDSLLANLFVLLGTAPAAPVFMLIMGAFLMKSKASTRQNIWRGIKLLIPIQYEDEHNSETESLAIKGFNLIYSVQLHIHLV